MQRQGWAVVGGKLPLSSPAHASALNPKASAPSTPVTSPMKGRSPPRMSGVTRTALARTMAAALAYRRLCGAQAWGGCVADCRLAWRVAAEGLSVLCSALVIPAAALTMLLAAVQAAQSLPMVTFSPCGSLSCPAAYSCLPPPQSSLHVMPARSAPAPCQAGGGRKGTRLGEHQRCTAVQHELSCNHMHLLTPAAVLQPACLAGKHGSTCAAAQQGKRERTAAPAPPAHCRCAGCVPGSTQPAQLNRGTSRLSQQCTSVATLNAISCWSLLLLRSSLVPQAALHDVVSPLLPGSRPPLPAAPARSAPCLHNLGATAHLPARA